MVNSCQLQHYHKCWARRGGCNHRVLATVQLGSQPRHSPFVGAAGQLTPQAAWCLRQRAGLLQAASQGHTSMSHNVGSEAPCGELGRDAPPRWKDTCQGRAHPEPETVDFGDRHHKKGAAGRNASCFDLSLSEELLQRVTELMQVTHTEA